MNKTHKLAIISIVALSTITLAQPHTISANTAVYNAIKKSVNNKTPNVEVVVYNRKTKQTTSYAKGQLSYNYNASIVKVSILTQLLHNKRGNLTASQKTLATKMITQSDNNAATKLYQQIGTKNGLNALYRNLKMTRSWANPNNSWGLASTHASDQQKLLYQIFYGGTYLNTKSKAYIQGLMTKVIPSQRWGLPKTTGSLAVKNGWLPLKNNYRDAVVNSLTRVKTKNTDYTVAIISNEDTTQQAGIDMAKRVGNNVFAVLNKVK